MMRKDTQHPYEVLVVLDPEFGERLKDWWPGRPVWIVASEVNNRVADSLWKNAPERHGHLTGISGLTHCLDRGREGCFLEYLYTIDLHHGPLSADPPYTVMRAIGVCLTPTIGEALRDYGFSRLEANPEGFVASRTLEEASRIRD